MESETMWNNLVAYSDTLEEHLIRMNSLLVRLSEVQLIVNLANCKFAKATVVYLGKVVGQGKVCAVQAKVSAVEGCPAPTTKKELQRFIGSSWGFCRNLSTVVAPLTDLQKS